MVICSINQFVLSSGEGLGGLEGPMPRGGASLRGGFWGSSCRLGVWGPCGFWFRVRVSLWGSLWVGGGSGVLDVLESSCPGIVPFDWGLLSGDGDLVGFWISLGPLLYVHGFSCGGALTRGYYLLALFPCTLFLVGWPFGHFAGGASSLLGVGLFGPLRYFFLG